MSDTSGSGRGALADELRSMRRLLRMGQRQLAALSGVSQGTIRDLETGKQTRPKPDTLRQIARGLLTNEDGKLDQDRAWVAYRRLYLAAGYSAEEPSPREKPLDPSVSWLVSDFVLDTEAEQLRQGLRWVEAQNRAEALLDRIDFQVISQPDLDMLLAILTALSERFKITDEDPEDLSVE